MGKRLVEVLAESTSLKDRFVCKKGSSAGKILAWNRDSEHNYLCNYETGKLIGIGFFSNNDPIDNEWVLLKGE